MRLANSPRIPLHLAALAALALLALPRSEAALITWAAPATIAADTDVSTAGSLLYAYNMGNTGVAGTTLNGVTFTPFAVPAFSGSPASNGSVTLSTSGGANFFSNNNSTSGNAPYTALSAAYKTLVSSGVAANNGGQSLNLGLGGLTLGNTYQFQAWSMDTAASFTGVLASKSFYSAGNSVTLDNNSADANGGVGQWVTGTFIADAATQTINIANVGGGTQGLQALNAFQVRAVPEPAGAWALALVLGTALAVRRRYRRAGAALA